MSAALLTSIGKVNLGPFGYNFTDLDSSLLSSSAISIKGQCHEIFDFFFHESGSPKPISIHKAVSIFVRKFLEIFAAQGANEKIYNQKVLNILFGTFG